MSKDENKIKTSVLLNIDNLKHAFIDKKICEKNL